MISKKILVSIVMGSQSDWKTLCHCEKIFKELKIGYEKKLSLHTEPHKDCMNMLKT